MITPNQHDELTLFLGCEELSRKTSLVDMSAFNMKIVSCEIVIFIVLIIAMQILTYKMLEKMRLYQNMTGLICVLFLLMKRRNPPKFLLSFLSINQGMWRSFLSSISLLKKGRRRREEEEEEETE
jgi:hypothetical protein